MQKGEVQKKTKITNNNGKEPNTTRNGGNVEMRKNTLALFLAVLMVLGSFVPVLNAEGNETEDKIYYWKVYSTDIRNGEENLIE